MIDSDKFLTSWGGLLQTQTTKDDKKYLRVGGVEKGTMRGTSPHSFLESPAMLRHA